MPAAAGQVHAVGRLSAAGPWVGFGRFGGGYRLVFGAADGSVLTDTTRHPDRRRDGLVAAVIAHYAELLDEPPADLEASQADLATLVAALIPPSTGGGSALVREALDAIDDGLPADAVMLRLQRLLPPEADPIGILTSRWARLRPR
ncbi:MAG: hypothetical protein ACRD0D_13745 [Acidimicrobiales bacterium]